MADHSNPLPRAIHSTLGGILKQLPALPSTIRYYDDFSDELRSIQHPAEASRFPVYMWGELEYVDFDQFSDQLALLLKHVFLHILSERLSHTTAALYTRGSRHLREDDFAGLLGAGPASIASFWVALLARDLQREAYACCKFVLRMLCKHRLSEWTDAHLDLISGLQLPFKDKYAVVRSGEAFLTVDDEAAIVRFFDHAAQDSVVKEMKQRKLENAAMLLCSYQFAMRPVQVALLTFRDMRVRRYSDEGATVHLTFRMAKQRGSNRAKPLLRRVKREWSGLFVEIERRAQGVHLDTGARLFGAKSAQEARQRIASCLQRIIDSQATANNLRHTAAQRLVDAGANQEELAEFMGHSDTTTGLVYYETSANQAERVNKALGISQIYKEVARIAHAGLISAVELAALKGTQQVGGAPHGVPIAGIGGCTSGQPSCPYNPVMACYGCRKFMPVHSIDVHAKVLDEFRTIARFFHDSSRGDAFSPTYLQLERTISAVQAVIVEIAEQAP